MVEKLGVAISADTVSGIRAVTAHDGSPVACAEEPAIDGDEAARLPEAALRA